MQISKKGVLVLGIQRARLNRSTESSQLIKMDSFVNNFFFLLKTKISVKL